MEVVFEHLDYFQVYEKYSSPLDTIKDKFGRQWLLFHFLYAIEVTNGIGSRCDLRCQRSGLDSY